jgi:hypothetical protein
VSIPALRERADDIHARHRSAVLSRMVMRCQACCGTCASLLRSPRRRTAQWFTGCWLAPTRPRWT